MQVTLEQEGLRETESYIFVYNYCRPSVSVPVSGFLWIQ